MKWNGCETTCADTSEVGEGLTLAKLEEVRKIMDEMPPVLVEIRVSCDVSCEIVRAIDQLPRSKVHSRPFCRTPVKEDEMIIRNRAVLKFSDGSQRLMIKDEHTGMFLTLGGDIPSVSTYLEILDRTKEWKKWTID